jgi:hypothetical protein
VEMMIRSRRARCRRSGWLYARSTSRSPEGRGSPQTLAAEHEGMRTRGS